jgi:hypothetical protein
MTTLLERAFAEAAKRPVAEQELLASRLLAELGDEDDFDRLIAGSTDKLALFAEEALEENRAGQTQNALTPNGIQMNNQWRSLITIEPGKRGGRPCIRGMRITVCDVFSYLLSVPDASGHPSLLRFCR